MLDKKNFYINGKWVKPKQKKDLHVIDPSTEENCAIISLGSPEDINIAVSAAKKAFESWAFTSYLKNMWRGILKNKIIRVFIFSL